MIQLNLGCGRKPDQGFVNVDAIACPGVDVVHDLDAVPWPWASGAASFIRAWDIFEHVSDPLAFMSECWRVLCPAGLLHVRTTYWKSENAYTDPTHKRFCTDQTFDFWIPGTDLYESGGAAYAGTVAQFERMHQFMDGQELCVILKKLNQ